MLIMVTKESSLWVLTCPSLSRIHTHYIFVSNGDFILEASHWSWLKTSSNILIHKVHEIIPFRSRQFFSYLEKALQTPLHKIKVFIYLVIFMLKKLEVTIVIDPRPAKLKNDTSGPNRSHGMGLQTRKHRCGVRKHLSIILGNIG